MLVMGLVLGQSLMVISTMDILLYAKISLLYHSSTLYIGMDEVFQHHAHTFEKSDLNFHFQCEFSSATTECVAMGNIHVHLKYGKNRITNKGDITKS